MAIAAAQRLEQQLQKQSINAATTVIAPFPTALLWRILLVKDDHYIEIFSSLLDDNSIPLPLTTNPNAHAACEQKIVNPADKWAISRMDWLTHGAIAAMQKNKRLVITDLRMGIER